MVKHILFLLLVITTTTAYGQVSEWLIAIDSTWEVVDVDMDSQGNAYVCGSSDYYGPQNASRGSVVINGTHYSSPNLPVFKYTTSFLAKVDSTGNAVWIRQMTGGMIDMYVIDVEVDQNDDPLIHVEFMDSIYIENDTSLAFPPGTQPWKYRGGVAKFSSNGNFQWLSVIPGKTELFGYYGYYGYGGVNTLSSDNNGNIYVLHDTVHTSNYFEENHVLKMDGSGNIIDSFAMGPYAPNFCLDANKNIWVPWSYRQNTASDTLLIRYDSLGNITYTLGITVGEAYIEHLNVDSKGNLYANGVFYGDNIVIAGQTIRSTNQWPTEFIMKINSFGHLRWVKTIRECVISPSWTGYNTITDMIIDDDDDLLVLGNYSHYSCALNDSFASPFGNDSLSLFIIKLDPNGSLIWSKYSYGQWYQSGNSMVKGLKDNIYVGVTGRDRPTDTMFVDNLRRVSQYGGYLYRLKDGGNLIGGKVYRDNNNNSMPDPGDRFIDQQIISVNGVNHYYTLTDFEGLYELYVPKGSYSADYNYPIKYHSPTPSSHSISFTGLNQNDEDNHFKMVPAPNISDMRVNLTPLGAWYQWWNSKAYVQIDFKNVGTTTLSDTCVLHFDPRLELYQASVPPSDTELTKLIWVFSNLEPYDKVSSSVIFKYRTIPGIFLGDTLNFYAETFINSSDSFPMDNQDSTSMTVEAPYDPNDKLVQPPGDILPEFVEEGNYLYYTIRFQNTGTAAATYVRINDTISDDLILESFEMISASHNYHIEFTNPNVFDFVFENINLPDSGTDWEASQGYVKFRIKADPTLSHGDYVENKAAIYFDWNEAVITNTVRTNIYDWTGEEELTFEDKGIFVYPNPNDGNFIIQIDDVLLSESRITVRDIMGRGVFISNSVRFDQGRTSLSLDQLDRGIYIVEVEAGGRQYNTRIIIQ